MFGRVPAIPHECRNMTCIAPDRAVRTLLLLRNVISSYWKHVYTNKQTRVLLNVLLYVPADVFSILLMPLN